MNYQIGSLSSLISAKTPKSSGKLVVKEFKLKTRKKNTDSAIDDRDVSTKPSNLKPKLKKSERTINVQETGSKKKKPRHKPRIVSQELNDQITDVKDVNKKKRKLVENSDSEEIVEKKKRKVVDNSETEQSKIEKDEEEDEKTIFVGNWPITKVKKHLKKYFARYGEIETVRFRSLPISDTRIPKKVTAITKQFHPDRTSTNAYVKFIDKKSAVKALKANGTTIENHHLRVTLSNSSEHDLSKSIFLGNLHFQVEDEDLWKMFGDCGEIDSVRIVRDSKTGVSKGVGYVNFQSKDGVELALKMDGSELKNRSIRVKRIAHNIKKKKEKEERLKHVMSNAEACQRRREKKNKGFQGVKITNAKNKKGSKRFKKSNKTSFKTFVNKTNK